ncbi:MAG TPA: hypothetical protein VNH83_03485 [Bryobacteraceae bacterium]|nr:hypothetical protein [Bryobacteraceae bacterium]
MKYLRMCVCLSLLLSPAVVHAQPATASDSAELVRALLSRVEQLEKRVAELEGRSGTPAPVAQSATGASPAVSAPAAQPPETAAAGPNQVASAPQVHMGHGGRMPDMNAPSTHLAGFSDIDFSATDKKGSRSGFNEGQFVLHLSSALSSKVSFFGELSMTARSDAGTGTPPATGFNVEVERSIIQFQENDYFKASFGRYHTPINYWNETFHHGQWLQTSISRPEMVQFGGSFLPIHFVGALVEGAVPAGGLNVNYNFGLGNGRSGVISRAGDWGDINNNRAWLVNLFSRPSALYGLQFGGSVYRDLITPVGPLAGTAFHEWIESAHVVWSKENPEVIAEFSNVTHQQVGGSLTSNSQAWYVQTAYRLPSQARLWKPYYRFEYIHIPGSDKLFKALPSLAGSTVGVRYDISGFAALKFEWRNLRRPGEPRVNGAFAQTSFTF